MNGIHDRHAGPQHATEHRVLGTVETRIVRRFDEPWLVPPLMLMPGSAIEVFPADSNSWPGTRW